MKPEAPAFLLIALGCLTAAAGAVLLREAAQPDEPRSGQRAFQELVGGLGFGPALDLSQCEFSFDPRLCPACSRELGPIPGGGYFCPHHACSVFYYPPPRR